MLLIIKRYSSYLVFGIFFLVTAQLFSKPVYADPWFTGPLLAPAGKTIPAGHVNFEPYAFYSEFPADFKNVELTPILTVGLTNSIDLQTALPYDYSWKNDQHDHHIGDYSLALGFQALRQAHWLPDLRFVLQEVFPTGRFEDLNPVKMGTDRTGLGSYQTYIGLNFQRLTTFQNNRYLRTRLTLTAACPSDVKVRGLNAFGGDPMTEGKVSPGNSYSVDLAFEYTLTQRWVPVFEALYVNVGNSTFNGNPGFTPGGTVASLGGGAEHAASLAPALEYNFNANLGIIGGVWFSVTGPHAARFTTTTIAINYFI